HRADDEPDHPRERDPGDHRLPAGVRADLDPDPRRPARRDGRAGHLHLPRGVPEHPHGLRLGGLPEPLPGDACDHADRAGVVALVGALRGRQHAVSAADVAPRRTRRRGRRSWKPLATQIALLLGAVTVVAPILYVVSVSLRSPGEYFVHPY